MEKERISFDENEYKLAYRALNEILCHIQIPNKQSAFMMPFTCFVSVHAYFFWANAPLKNEMNEKFRKIRCISIEIK